MVERKVAIVVVYRVGCACACASNLVVLTCEQQHGCRCSNNEAMGVDEENGVIIEEQGERKQRGSRRKSFRECVGDNGGEVYYEHVETGDIVLELPEDGDVVM